MNYTMRLLENSNHESSCLILIFYFQLTIKALAQVKGITCVESQNIELIIYSEIAIANIRKGDINIYDSILGQPKLNEEIETFSIDLSFN